MTTPGDEHAHHRRRTSRSVYLMDRVARIVVTGGGLAVLAAVLGICVYLFATVLPLFSGGSAERDIEPVMIADAGDDIVSLWADDFVRGVLVLHRDGRWEARLLEDAGQRRAGEPVVSGVIDHEGAPPTAWSVSPGVPYGAAGFSDGSVRMGEFGFDWRLALPEEVEPEMRELAIGDAAPMAAVGFEGTGWVERADEEAFRIVVPRVEFGNAASLGDRTIAHLAYRVDGRRKSIAAVFDDGSAEVNTIRETRPLGGGAPRVRFRETPIELEIDVQDVKRLRVSDAARFVYTLDRTGELTRYDAQAGGGVGWSGRVASGGDGTPIEWLAGGKTLLVGTSTADASGAVQSYASITEGRPDNAGPEAMTAELRTVTDRLVSLARSMRDRVFAVLGGDGRVEVWHHTARARIAAFDSGTGERGRLVVVAPRADAVLVMDASGAVEAWRIEAGHAEASANSLFGRVWYEGQAGPSFVYQSSAGSDDAETKLSITPLLFGTIKATVFAMLFAAPIGVLAAIYTSEFVSPEVHRVIKPSIELMASLPSVVLGFIAAFVVAPFVRDWLPAVLVAFVTVPVVIVIGARLWEAMPSRIARRFDGGGKLVLITLAVAVGVFASGWTGPLIERALFTPDRADLLVMAGSVRDVDLPEPGAREIERGRLVVPVEPEGEAAMQVAATIAQGELDQPSLEQWLNGAFGNATSGWMLLCFGPALVVIFLLERRFVGRSTASLMQRVGTPTRLMVGVARSVLLLAAAGCVAYVLAMVAAGFSDPRDTVFGPFDQRNTLVVGLIMGVAVIPIIYTISDDAMRSVPSSLRAASLGAGATPWQTAVRVVLPVAGSGIFSACMIGLGRAVGETMIVLMATGNTPEMDWNIFSGFRTLAANIAVELPEAPKDSTHYRVLFLCGLVLFVLTFVINTVAELVRQRFRKRNAAL
ncbi:MAG: ABC transporter permease subunit [Planctomycetota bacterium]